MIAKLKSGCLYHIYNRGNNRDRLFYEQRNYDYFLELYNDYIGLIATTYAYCLMPNHFHFLSGIKESAPPKSDSSQRFSNFYNAYAKSINKAYGRSGALFQRPFQRIEVESLDYSRKLVCYIHLNPEKHGLTGDFRFYPHSSFLQLTSDAPTWLARDEVLSWFGGVDGFFETHRSASRDLGLAFLVGEDQT